VQNEIKFYKIKSITQVTEKDALWCVKADNESTFRLFVTDLNGIPIPLKDLTGSSSSGITSITSGDGSIVITGTASTKNIQISPSLSSLILSALQSGDALSSLLNDVGYITAADIPVFVPSDYDLEDFTNAGADPFVKESQIVGIDHSNRSILDAITEAFTTTLKTAYDGVVTWVATNGTNILNHIASNSNPHNVTKSQVGLSDVPNIDTSTTTNITEGTKLFFTTTRVLSTLLSGLSIATGGTIVDSDTILIALGKLQNQINSKQDTLTFDSVPTDGSTNPVESNGVFDAIAAILQDPEYRLKYGINYFNDFIGISQTDTGQSINDITLAYSQGGTGAANLPLRGTNTIGAKTSSNVGILGSSTGTTATGSAGYFIGSPSSGSNIGVIEIGIGNTYFQDLKVFSQLSTVTNRYYAYCCLAILNSTNPANFIGFVYDEGGVTSTVTNIASANWRAVTINAGVRTITDTGIAVSATTFQKLRCEINALGTQVLFYINGVLVATHITNIPTGDSKKLGFSNYIAKTIGTTACIMYSDYILINQTLATPRT
jgi:hypothetical protein